VSDVGRDGGTCAVCGHDVGPMHQCPGPPERVPPATGRSSFADPRHGAVLRTALRLIGSNPQGANHLEAAVDLCEAGFEAEVFALYGVNRGRLDDALARRRR
jgi:hypothetical protein